MTEPRVASAVLRREGRVLLCHRRAARECYADCWDLPGGLAPVRGQTRSEDLA